jgi:protein-S-isoprenylcysteine O-methyltransferase Ste14
VSALWLALKNVVFAIVVPGFVAGWAPVAIAGGFERVRAFGLPQLAGSAVLAAGLTLLLTAIAYFGAVGHGTPAPFDPPVRLVVRGPHRYVRNPMYLGAVVAVLGWALWFESAAVALYAAAVWLGFHVFVLAYEEPTLRRLFGADYDAYRAAVRRWIPGRPR